MRYLTGFDCISRVQGDGLDRFPVAAATTITKGDAVDVAANSGYAAGLTLMTTGFVGIAAETVDNSAGAAGAKYVQVIPPSAGLRFSVPVENNALITQAAVGLFVDLESEDGIDISDVTPVGFGIKILSIDASTEAVAAATYGYAIGRFVSCNIA